MNAQQKDLIGILTFFPCLEATLWRMNNGSYQASFVNPKNRKTHQIEFESETEQKAKNYLLLLLSDNNTRQQIHRLLDIDENF
jgi:hypothetical protein